jgi:membrane associated rhomboid family serine protease
MFPIRDHNPSVRTPYVTYALIAANVLVFLAMLGLPDARSEARFLAEYALVPGWLTRGGDLSPLITSLFLHAGLLHLAGNMLFLYVFGDNLEDTFGHLGFLVFYLACGIGAGLAHVLSDPASTIPTIGASGAIAGVMGGYLLLFPRARVDVAILIVVFVRIIPMSAWIVLALWFGLQVLNGATADLSGGGVAYWAHAGGFALGAVFTLPAWARRGGPAFWSRTQGHPPHAPTRIVASRTSVPSVRRRR